MKKLKELTRSTEARYDWVDYDQDARVALWAALDRAKHNGYDFLSEPAMAVAFDVTSFDPCFEAADPAELEMWVQGWQKKEARVKRRHVPLAKRFEMVFVFDQSKWALKAEQHQIFRLGDSFYVADVVSGNLVVARPFHHHGCSYRTDDGPDIPVGDFEVLYADEISLEIQFEKENN